MIYAPVIVPTLNRKKHLERCLTSLSKNTEAKETDIIISVDFPPRVEYVEGYKQVIEFLEKDQMVQNSFKSIKIFKQKKNLGVTKNIEFLINYVRTFSKCYIFTEDDNEFAPNFLEYINKGLDLFKYNKNVIAICGCKDTEFKAQENFNILASKLFSGYGIGVWLENHVRLETEIPDFLLNKNTYSAQNLRELKRKDRVLYNIYLTKVLMGNKPLYWNNGVLNCIDSVKSIYMHFTNAFCVVPSIGKSRTWGNDGTGVNMKNRLINPEKEWILDDNVSFDYVFGKNNNLMDLLFIEENYEIGNQYMNICNSKIYDIKADIYYLLLFFCSFDRLKAKKIAIRIFGD